MPIVSLGVPGTQEDLRRAVAEFLPGYEALVRLGVGFYPTKPDKSPGVGAPLARHLETDPWNLYCRWHYQGFRSFAFRIPRGCRLFVVDTEGAFKHGRTGPDGELVLGELLLEHGIILPPCPTVGTPSDGFHRYLLMPKGISVRSAIALWPGVDILAAGSNVLAAGSHLKSGDYTLVRSFDEWPIPEAPSSFVKLIRGVQKTRGATVKRAPQYPIPTTDTGVVTAREWWRLSHNAVFKSFWNRKGKIGDRSDSAYEYHLAKACLCCGLSRQQTLHVIGTWHSQHRLPRDLTKVGNVIIPAAWCEVEPWVREWTAEKAAAREARNAKKTNPIILDLIRREGYQTPASVAAALTIPRERAKKALQRMAAAGLVVPTEAGYGLA